MAKKGKGKKRKSGILGFLFRVALTISAIALILSYLSLFINPAKFWLPSFFGLYFIPILIINITLLTLAVIRLSASAWLPIIVLIPTVFIFKYYYKFDNKDDVVTTVSDKYTIVTYNTGQFSSASAKTSRKTTTENITSFIQGKNPDIICLQEFYIDDPSNIKNIFPQHPYKYYHLFKIRGNYYFGNLTASKHPIVSKGKITFDKGTNLSIYTDIKLGDKIVRLYNNHLESYNLSPASIIKRLKDGIKLSDELKEVHSKMKISNMRRAHQVDEIVNHIKDCRYRCIVCGDFNDTPLSYTYQQLCSRAKDTFLEGGEGFSSTYSYLWPFLRIDYILVPEEYTVKNHITPRVRFSDHYPVITEISE